MRVTGRRRAGGNAALAVVRFARLRQDDGRDRDRTNGSTRTPRAIADAYVDALVVLDPVLATSLGAPEGQDRWPDWSPDGAAAGSGPAPPHPRRARRGRGVRRRAGPLDAPERRCARLLRERLTQSSRPRRRRAPACRRQHPLAAHEVREAFTLMPRPRTRTGRRVAARLRAVPHALDGLPRVAGGGPRPRAARRAAAGGDRRRAARPAGWARAAAGSPASPRPARGLRARARHRGARRADAASPSCATGCADVYAPAGGARRDTVGRERYARWARLGTAPTWTWTRRTRTAGRSSTASTRRCGPRPEGPARRDPVGGADHLDEHGHAHRGRGRGPRLAAGADGRGHRGAGRHALRPRRAGQAGRVA